MDNLLQLVLSFINVETWRESQQIVEEHPELLRLEVDSVMEELALKEEDEGVKGRVEMHRILLARCREVGIQKAFSEKMRGRRGYIYSGLRADLAEMERLEALRLASPQVVEQLIELYQHILGQFQPGEQPVLCASIRNRLANAYNQLPTGDRTANLRVAIRYYQEALETYTFRAMPHEYATIQNNLGSAYFFMPTNDRAKNLTRAISCYTEALRVYTPETAPNGYAMTQTNLGTAYLFIPTGNREANLRQAITCFQEALRFQSRPHQIAVAQNNLASAYLEMPTGNLEANLTQTIQYCQKALSIWTKDTAPLYYAMAQHNYGSAYLKMPTGNREQNLRQAIKHFQEALRFRTPKSAQEDYATTQNNLGNAYSSLPTGDPTKNLTEAIKCYTEALRFRTPESAPLDYAMTQNNLGAAYLSLPTGDRGENLTRAIACYQQALRFRSAESTPYDYAMAQHNLGMAYYLQPVGNREENLAQAIKYFQEALRFRTFSTSPYDYAMSQHSLGTAYFGLLMGDREANLTQAIRCFEEALRVYTPEESPFDYAGTQINLGTTYLFMPTGDREANLTRAIECYQKALPFQTPTTAPARYADIQNNLGIAYYYRTELREARTTGNRQANLKRAIECYKETLRVRTKETAPYRYASTQNNLGLAYQEISIGGQIDKLAEAMSCYEEALQVRHPSHSPSDYAMTQLNLGLLYIQLSLQDAPRSTSRQAKLTQAIHCLQEVQQFYTPETAPDNCRRTNRSLANLYFAQADWAAALAAYRIAMDAGERLYQAGLSAVSRATEIAENTAFYRDAAFATARLGKPSDALLTLERGKTRLLSEALRLRVPRPNGVPDDIWNAFEQASSTVRVLQSLGPGKFSSEDDPVQTYQARIQRVREANKRLDDATRHLRNYAPNFLSELDLETIRPLIPKQGALVAFCLTNQGCLGLILSSNHPVKLVEVPNFTATDLDDLLFGKPNEQEQATSGWIATYQSQDKTRWHSTMEQILAEIGQKLLAPILAALSEKPAKIKKLLLLPSGGLFLLPLHAAPLSDDGKIRLCDRYQVSYAPSAEVLTDLRRKTTNTSANDLLAVINPEEDPNLPFTSAEGAAISSLFDEHQVLMRRAGTKEAVMNGVRGRAYLHFSCHGTYNWDDPPASALALADGRLTLAELQSGEVDMSAARLVTLSACETGMTDIIKGSPEEYVGLPAGFMLAGVPCVVASLWAVRDISTALLMERFYRNHLESGMDLVAALHDAQQWLRHLPIGEVVKYAEKCFRQAKRKDKAQLFTHMNHYRYRAQQDPNERPFAHPYYWAAFTVNGM